MITLNCTFTLHLSGRNERYYRSNPDLVKERLIDQLSAGLDPHDDLHVSNVKVSTSNPKSTRNPEPPTRSLPTPLSTHSGNP